MFFALFPLSGGFSYSCHGNVTYYDECNRMCSCTGGKIRPCKRVRHDFGSMNKEERIRFMKAFKHIASKEPFKTEYQRLVFKYNKFFHCVNKPKFFLPWHRAFLLYLENLLRQVDCSITLPYLDWTKKSGNLWDALYRMDVLSKNESAGSERVMNRHKKQTCLRRHFHGIPPDSETVKALLSFPLHNFAEFELILRVIFHHSVLCHGIGGHIFSNEAALEFVLLTAFVDKLWGRWQSSSNLHRDTGFPGVSNKLPGFYQRYVGEVQRLEKQPGCVKIIYSKSTE